MIVEDADIERMVGDIIETHGSRAAWAAAERVNEMIDRGNTTGRDLWARVVHAIHARQGTGPPGTDGLADWRGTAPLSKHPARLPALL